MKAYAASPKDRYGHVYAVLEVATKPIDLERYPDSHYHAVAQVMKVVEVSADAKKIKTCEWVPVGVLK